MARTTIGILLILAAALTLVAYGFSATLGSATEAGLPRDAGVDTLLVVAVVAAASGGALALISSGRQRGEPTSLPPRPPPA
jgi:hypothetical protein